MIMIAAATALGCTRPRGPARTSLSLEHFVVVVSELSTAPPEQRAAILRKHRTSDAEVREFVVANARDPERLALALDSVAARIERKRTATP